ncbi:hypothetical protein UY3_04846 [Chelonia mydas]|uniref:Uncharacterized protein n=1 Tax=Chelonia mydas TaxID=8469 RepID=M7BL62_CHEMY|nr:hypothetical protein UY3_04846 [Chelonia mydas]
MLSCGAELCQIQREQTLSWEQSCNPKARGTAQREQTCPGKKAAATRPRGARKAGHEAVVYVHATLLLLVVCILTRSTSTSIRGAVCRAERLTCQLPKQLPTGSRAAPQAVSSPLTTTGSPAAPEALGSSLSPIRIPAAPRLSASCSVPGSQFRAHSWELGRLSGASVQLPGSPQRTGRWKPLGSRSPVGYILGYQLPAGSSAAAPRLLACHLDCRCRVPHQEPGCSGVPSVGAARLLAAGSEEPGASRHYITDPHWEQGGSMQRQGSPQADSGMPGRHSPAQRRKQGAKAAAWLGARSREPGDSQALSGDATKESPESRDSTLPEIGSLRSPSGDYGLCMDLLGSEDSMKESSMES